MKMGVYKKNDRCLILLVILLSTTGLVAQKSRLTDYVVLEANDTLYGQVEYIDERGVHTRFYKKLRFTAANGKKRKFKRKNVIAFKADERVYQRFWLLEEGFLTTRFYMDPAQGTLHFLRVRDTGPLGHYELEWFEQANATLYAMALLKKERDSYFIRADQGLLGLKTKAVKQYLADCPAVVVAIEAGELKQVWQVVAFYNRHCL